MTSDEFRAALAALGMTQRGFAALVDVDERTARRWSRGQQDVPGWVPVLLKLLASQPPS